MVSTQAIKNTLKMMGVSSKDAMFFGDALDSLKVNVYNKKVRKSYQDIIFNTVIMGKPLKEWAMQFIEEAIENGTVATFINESGGTQTNPVKKDDFLKFEDYHCGTFVTILKQVLQVYFEKEKILD